MASRKKLCCDQRNIDTPCIGIRLRYFRIVLSVTPMTQTVELLNTLKKCLKAKGLNYRDLAEALNLSEASIKRLFPSRVFRCGDWRRCVDFSTCPYTTLRE